MTRRFASFYLALALLLIAGALPAAEAPPADLHFVDGHWTAWNPPTDLPEDVEVYVIVAGDTLWHLAERFYGDPYLWPQLWESNQYILDAHWIYPGDPLAVGVEVTELEDLAALGDEGPALEDDATSPEEQEPQGIAAQLALDSGRPVPLGTESDIYCSGYIGEVDQSFQLFITGSEYEVLTPSLGSFSETTAGTWGSIDNVKYGMATGDIVYTDGGRASGMRPGQLYTAIEIGRRVTHPLRGKIHGRFYQYVGRLRILAVQEETAIAEIVHACDQVVIGAGLIPFEPTPVPLARVGAMRPVNFPAAYDELDEAPVILYAHYDIVSLAEDNVVYIDLGAQEGATPGDLYTIYRLNRRGRPPVVVGELAVLAVHEHSSVARIIRTRYSVYVGDRLERK